MKNHRPTLSYSVLTFCELNNEKYDYSFISGKIKKRISNLKQGKQWAPIIPTAQLLVQLMLLSYGWQILLFKHLVCFQ